MALVVPSSAWAQQRDCDFDWIAGTLDQLVSGLAAGFSYPLAGVDNDGNGMFEEDTLAMLSSVLRGGTRVAGLNAAMVTSIQADFAYNRLAADWDMQATGTGQGGNCWLLGMAGMPCKLTDILIDQLGAVVGGLLNRILLDLMGGMVTAGDRNATFTFLNAYLDAILDAFKSSLDASLQQYVDGIKPDIHLVPTWYRTWGENPSRLNRFGPNGNLDYNVDGTSNAIEYAAAGATSTPGYRETFLSGMTIVPPIHITNVPAGGTFQTGDAHTLVVTFAGGIAPFTYQWENAEHFADSSYPTNYGLEEINDGPGGTRWEGITGSDTATLSFYYLLTRHDNLKPWLRMSDTVTVYNTIAAGTPAGCIEPEQLGGRTSVYADMTVTLRAFAITPQPLSGQYYVGDAVTLISGATGGDSVPTYQWRKDGTDMAGSTTVTVGSASILGAR